MSFSWFADTPAAPAAQPDQPKESGGPSLAKEDTQTAPSEPAQPETKPAPTTDKTAPVIASAGEQDKEPAPEATSTSQAKDAATERTVAAPAPAANSQAPVSTPALSEVEVPPKLTSDSTGPHIATNPATSGGMNANGATLNAAVSTPDPDPDRDPEKGEELFPTTTGEEPAQPGAGETEQRALMRRRRNEIIQTRLAKFFTWILLLAFVILPGTFTRLKSESDASQCGSSPANTTNVANIPLFAIVYICAAINGGAICWLWYLKANDHEWLYTYLFSPGFLYSLSGLITTLVNVYGVQKGRLGTASSTTLAVTITCTILYGVLTVVYHQKRSIAIYRRRRNRGRPS
ncbi:hypothetical protein BJV74DRAFT_815871 [Russula compacta]|nr:hypothetical protein BJV74DRAFT_815871 [Russula compacta]